jgi:tryptophan 2,3-dioxygenase
MLFIILQQAQELWFKQLLHELHLVVSLLERRALLEAIRVLDRIIRILTTLAEELKIMETIQQAEFQLFRHLLTPSSGFESGQFRELELASGLRHESHLRMLQKIIDLPDMLARWPRSVHDLLLDVMRELDEDPIEALVRVYSTPAEHPKLFALAEALMDYELGFQEWRYHHLRLVERVIGDKSPGTGGSAGSGYLIKTLGYRFFPELWETRNQISAGSIPSTRS